MGFGRGRLDSGRRVAALVAVGGLVTVGAVVVAGEAVAALPGEAPAATAARPQPLVTGTPCSVSAKACVDLDSQRAWLIKDGKIMRGPVKIASGGNGEETPVGHSLRVYRKEKDHVSKESRLANGQPAPMPWSVFFEDGGIAFHSGSPEPVVGGLHPPRARRRRGLVQLPADRRPGAGRQGRRGAGRAQAERRGRAHRPAEARADHHDRASAAARGRRRGLTQVSDTRVEIEAV